MKQIRYTTEQREWAIQQMMPPLNLAVVELAKTTGITTVTLRTWQKMARAEGRIMLGDGKKSDQWSSTNKFRIVLETAPLSEAELSAYCRTKGLYPEQVAQWRLICEQANAPVTAKSAAISEADAKQAQRIRELERTLKKKEAALAEAAALLVLEKKAEAIWGKGKAE
jgi:DNA-binding transcriptional MerR regulator